MKQTGGLARAGAAAGIALCCIDAIAGNVEVEFSFTRFSSTFAEHSTAFRDGDFTTWQGGRISWAGGSGSGSADLPAYAESFTDAFVAISPSGVRYSQPREHPLAVPEGASQLSFDESMGWQWTNGFRYEPFPSRPEATNTIQFSAAQATGIARGDVFRLGTFSVTNGSWYSPLNGGLDPVEIGFRIRTRSADPLLDGHEFQGTLGYATYASVGGTALENADAYWIVERPELGAARVFELQSGSFELYGHIGSLEVDGFGNPSGGVILTASIEAIPEPSTCALLTLGFGWVVWSTRRKLAGSSAVGG